jgi:hypothetical protein
MLKKVSSSESKTLENKYNFVSPEVIYDRDNSPLSNNYTDPRPFRGASPEPMFLDETRLTQEEVDRHLFETRNSLNPYLDEEGNINIYVGDTVVILNKTDKLLGEGTYGKVYVYKSNYIKYAVKFSSITPDGKVSDGNEREAVLELRNVYLQNDIWCNVIQSRIVDSTNKHATLMPVMYGDLFDLMALNILSSEDKKEILESLREQMECIINLNSREVIEHEDQENFKFAYLDLKPANILYKIIFKDGKIKYDCRLGDLGGIIKGKNGHFISSIMLKTSINIDNYNTQILSIPQKDRKMFKDQMFHYAKYYIVNCMRYVFGVNACMLMYNTSINPNIDRLIELNDALVRDLGLNYSNLLVDHIDMVRTSMYS